MECFCVCERESVFLLALLLSALMCIYSIVVLLRSCAPKSPSWAVVVGGVGAPLRVSCQRKRWPIIFFN